MGDTSFTVCLFVCLFVRLRISQRRKKGSGVKLCRLVRLLSGMSFSHFDELWLAWSHGGGTTSGMSYIHIAPAYKSYLGKKLRGQDSRTVGMAVWWDLRLASLLIDALVPGIFC